MTDAANEELPTYYEVLRVDEDAEPSEAYLRIAQKCHPDKCLDNPLAKETFQELQKAYEVLSDPQERAAYDERLDKLQNPILPPPMPTSSHSVFEAEFAPSTRIPARPRFAQPPPYHPLFNMPIIISSDIVWVKARLSQRVHHPQKILHPYWRPIAERVPIPPPPPPQFRPFPSSIPPLPREYVQRVMIDMEVHMARVRWLAEVRARGGGCR
ncbi:hypothetical protein I204_07898 [Kwoniella mangroviensis CBS 8886]|uniref:hypothetical protein n=1 Tax=Kwoniella mangroviensis CBS 8507 TaxID=1296122 RepID=UPI00080D5305|nr:uncharacterized protein I203_05115 [Kwoniella mangroviensis CBS 8507]OCF65440.1 hypothetical protein I203_05115 [Kwoniella mangroviensis CBS 8507]OCF71835.1 hypothetical protein I204_07898 [Kwoniella mangroviensis CBS 8886]